MSIQATSVVLVFPKRFELLGFLDSIKDSSGFQIINKENFTHVPFESSIHCESYLVKYEYKGAFLILYCISINASDINFLFRFSDYAEFRKLADEETITNRILESQHDLRRQYNEINSLDEKKKILLDYIKNNVRHEITYILMGTAGSGMSNLGESFIVSKAWKVDRGILRKKCLDAEKSNLIVEFNSQAAFANSTVIFKDTVEMREIICTNYVAHAFPIDLYANADNTWLIDMETYEFFKVCESKRLRCGCIRIVSDVYNDNDSFGIADVGRKCIKFDTLVVKLRDLLVSSNITAVEPNENFNYEEDPEISEQISNILTQRKNIIKAKFEELRNSRSNESIDELMEQVKLYFEKHSKVNVLLDLSFLKNPFASSFPGSK
jgi:hypothetical protein